MTRERRLGRGLEALLGGIARPAANAPVAAPSAASFGSMPGDAGDSTNARHSIDDGGLPSQAAEAERTNTATGAAAGMMGESTDTLRRVPIDRIAHNPSQPRTTFDPLELAQLAESIAAHGLLQPIVVRCVENGYELVAGERRLRAAKELQWTEVPVQIVKADPRESAEFAIVENLHRKDLDPLEKALSFQRYLETYESTQEELARRLKIDRSTISNLIRLLELPEEVQQAIRAGKITQGHARALLPLGDEDEQVAFCRRIQQETLSVRATEALVQQRIDSLDAEPLGVVDRAGHRAAATIKPRNEQLAAFEQRFRAALGLKAQLTHNARGRGKLVIHFRSFEEFERLEEMICGPEAARRTG